MTQYYPATQLLATLVYCVAQHVWLTMSGVTQLSYYWMTHPPRHPHVAPSPPTTPPCARIQHSGVERHVSMRRGERFSTMVGGVVGHSNTATTHNRAGNIQHPIPAINHPKFRAVAQNKAIQIRFQMM